MPFSLEKIRYKKVSATDAELFNQLPNQCMQPVYCVCHAAIHVPEKRIYYQVSVF